MLIEQLFDPGLGHASYLVADPDSGVAFLVDPDRNVERYLEIAARLDVLITHSLETHVHNDYVAGSPSLASLRPITVVTGAAAQVDYPHIGLRDGATLKIGEILVRCVATPGHTPEHVSFLVSDLRRADDPQWLFSGGALLVDNIARVDLLGPELAERLARDAFGTLRERVLTLPDHLAVFPTHGGGSSCAGTVSGTRWTTLGFERRHNATAIAALGAFGAFHEHLSRSLPAAPPYYPHVRALNAIGGSLMSRVPLRLLTDDQLRVTGLTMIDARPPGQFAAGHRPGALNVVGNDAFAARVGATIPFGTALVLLCHAAEQAHRLRDQLLIIGYDDVRGYADPAPEGPDLVALPQLDPRGGTLPSGALLLDVREPAEWQEGHIPGALHVPLARLRERLVEIPGDRPVVVYCASGIRSSLAASLLEASGRPATNLRGGFAAWQRAGLPVAS